MQELTKLLQLVIETNGNSYNYDGADNFGLGLQVGGRYFFNEILEKSSTRRKRSKWCKTWYYV
jgi:hypothetical protein